MTQASTKSKPTAADTSLRKTFEEAIESLQRSVNKLDENQLLNLKAWLEEEREELPKNCNCNDVEEVQPFSVLCLSCSKFKAHHLWPCPNFIKKPFYWIKPSGDGELVLSESIEEYFQHDHVKVFVFK